MDHLDPLYPLPLILQGLIAVATFVLIFVIGRYIMLTLGLVHWLWRYERARGQFVDTDDSRGNMAVPKELTDTNRQLYELGYVPFGTMLRSYPSIGHRDIYHILTTSDETTTARFNRASPPYLRVSFVTWFQDSSVIVTEHPHGYALETDRIINNFIRESVSATHDYHRRRVAEWTGQGRSPKPISGMAEYIQHQVYFMTHYNGLFGNPARNMMALLIVPTLLATGAAIGLLIATNTLSPAWAGAMLLVLGLSALARDRLSKRYTNFILHPPGAADDTPDAA